MTFQIGQVLPIMNGASAEQPFLNILKTTGDWTPSSGSPSGLTLDSDCYPTSIPGGAGNSVGLGAVLKDLPTAAETGASFGFQGLAGAAAPSAAVQNSTPGRRPKLHPPVISASAASPVTPFRLMVAAKGLR